MEKGIYNHTEISFVKGKITRTKKPRPVRILCIVGKWAMVRSTEFRAASPYVISSKDLEITK